MVCNVYNKNKGKNKLKVKVNLTNELNENLLPEKVLLQIAKWALKEIGQTDANVVVSAFFVDENKIYEINKNYRGKEKPTDVISFRLVDNPNFLQLNKQNFPIEYDGNLKAIYLGEIFICKNVAMEQAPSYGNSLQKELAELFCHGMFHILGFDHENEKDKKIMKQHEMAVCKKIDDLVK